MNSGKTDIELVDNWSYDKIDKQKFFEAAQNATGADLAKLMTQELSELRTASSEVKLVGTGSFLDVEDLKEKYKAKPARLEAILKNARKIWDDVSECYLIEDMAYQSVTTAGESTTRTAKRTCETEEKVKKAKVAKVKTEEENVPKDGETEDKPLGVSQLKWVEKQLTTLATNLEKIKAVEEEFGPADKRAPFVEHLPLYVLTSMTATSLEVDAFREMLLLVKEANKAAGFKNIQATAKELAANFKERHRRAVLQIAEAKVVSGE